GWEDQRHPLKGRRWPTVREVVRRCRNGACRCCRELGWHWWCRLRVEEILPFRTRHRTPRRGFVGSTLVVALIVIHWYWIWRALQILVVTEVAADLSE